MLNFARRRAPSLESLRRASNPRRQAMFQLQSDIGRTPGQGSRRPNGRRYRPGDTVRQSGIYEVLHDRGHREVHEAVMISGEQFPDCETCKERVRFRLVRTAPYIFQDEDFEDDPQ
jgi:hypothetical protein